MSYTTVADVKTYLGIAGTADDALLGALITSADAIIEDYTHRVFQVSAASTRYFDAEMDVDGDTLWLGNDLYTIGTVTNGDGNALGTADYVTTPRNSPPYYQIVMRSDSTAAWTYDDHPENAIAVTGLWSAGGTAAPPAIAHASKRLTAWLYAQKDNHADQDRAFIAGNTTVLPVNIPADVKAILEPHRKKVAP